MPSPDTVQDVARSGVSDPLGVAQIRVWKMLMSSDSTVCEPVMAGSTLSGVCAQPMVIEVSEPAALPEPDDDPPQAAAARAAAASTAPSFRLLEQESLTSGGPFLRTAPCAVGNVR